MVLDIADIVRDGDVSTAIATSRAELQAIGSVWTFLLGRNGVVVIPNHEQPGCKTHSSIDQRV
jgi:hypothetical protein